MFQSTTLYGFGEGPRAITTPLGIIRRLRPSAFGLYGEADTTWAITIPDGTLTADGGAGVGDQAGMIMP